MRVRAHPDLWGYCVSDTGRVFSTKLGMLREMKQCLVSGYPALCLYTSAGKKTFRVHTLVLETFVGPRPVVEGERLQCRHLDGDRENNRVENLRWGTAVENNRDKREHGTEQDLRGEERYNSKLTEGQVTTIREFAASGVPQRELAEMYSVSKATLSRVVNRKTWAHVGAAMVGSPEND